MQYEIINKVTGECTPVVMKETSQQEGVQDDYVLVALEDGTTVRFENPNMSGQLSNDEYALREVGSHIEADGTGTIEMTADGIVDSDGVAPIPAE
jgi:hypothetical protein